MKRKPRKRNPSESELRETLSKIAHMGRGIKSEVIDWANIGKNAVYVARETLEPKCIECGKK